MGLSVKPTYEICQVKMNLLSILFDSQTDKINFNGLSNQLNPTSKFKQQLKTGLLHHSLEDVEQPENTD